LAENQNVKKKNALPDIEWPKSTKFKTQLLFGVYNHKYTSSAVHCPKPELARFKKS
jgi:hypothetical protein